MTRVQLGTIDLIAKLIRMEPMSIEDTSRNKLPTSSELLLTKSEFFDGTSESSSAPEYLHAIYALLACQHNHLAVLIAKHPRTHCPS